MSPDDLSNFAVNMAQKSVSEVEYRCCASKAYYSAYHRAKQVADQVHPQWEDKPSFLGAGIHARLARAFGNVQVPAGGVAGTLKKIGRALTCAKVLRVKADYELAYTFSEKELRVVRYRAEEIERLVNTLTKPGGEVIHAVHQLLPPP